MTYFVTGATGFIGSHLVSRLLAREGTIRVLVREESRDRLDERIAAWGTGPERVVPVVGDLTAPRLGVFDEDLDALRGEVDHVFHLAAVYDIEADEQSQREANVDGTRNVVGFANAVGAGRLHHVSSIAAAGNDYRGEWREDMFEQAEGLDQPYFATKHEAEGVVRRETEVPWRIYRPAIVVGDSRTGVTDKIDGPYYFFKLIQRLRRMFPPWLPLIGIEGRPVNIVPVDFVADALDHIAHLEDANWDDTTFHLTDPNPYRVGQIMNIFMDAAHAPRFGMRIDSRAIELIPKTARSVIGSLPPIANARKAVLGDLGIPDEVLRYINWPTTYARSNTDAALEGTDIEVPRLEDYAAKLWDYWERNLDPELFKDRSLKGAIGERTVMVTGASDGIGREIALVAAEAQAHVLLVSRTREKLEAVKAEIEEAGGTASVHPCDLSDLDDIDRLVKEVLAEHGTVDVLINNAGRSIRRSVRLSFDRFHDYERTMTLNYFGAVKLILGLLPAMLQNKSGHIINVSSIGVQTNTPRFSAYVASKAALDAFSRCIASEIIDNNVHVTTVYMPLVRTKMISPTKMYDYFPTLSPEEAAEMVCNAMIGRPKKAATGLGNFGEVMYAISPKVVDQVLHQAYRIFPDSAAAKGEESQRREKASAEGVAFAHLLKGVHW